MAKHIRALFEKMERGGERFSSLNGKVSLGVDSPETRKRLLALMPLEFTEKDRIDMGFDDDFDWTPNNTLTNMLQGLEVEKTESASSVLAGSTLGLDFGTEDSVWDPVLPDAIEEIRKAPWKVVDVETTGLTPGSKPVRLQARQALSASANLRLRILTVAIPTQSGYHKTYAFDLDEPRRTEEYDLIRDLAQASLTGGVFGHNIGFDLFWLFREAGSNAPRPSQVVDTMLLARLLMPRFPVEVAEYSGWSLKAIEEKARSQDEQDLIQLKVDAATKIAKDSPTSVWSLDTLCLFKLGKKLDKTYQKPRNWVAAVLTEAHREYATADVDDLFALLEHEDMLNLDPGADILKACLDLTASRADMKLVDGQVEDVLSIRQAGMPIARDNARRFYQTAFDEAAVYAREMAEHAPILEDYVDDLADPEKGISANLKQVLAKAFRDKGVPVRATAKTGEPMVGEKDLRLAGAELIESAIPLFHAWVKVAKAKKAGTMARDLIGFADRWDAADGVTTGRIYPLLSHGPATGRLSSSEPNAQQFPGRQDFRDIVHASPDTQIISCDYSALDVRVGAGLCIRTQREINQLFVTGELRKRGISERRYEKAYEVIRKARLLEEGTALDELADEFRRQSVVIESEMEKFREAREWRVVDDLKVDFLAVRLGMRYAQVRKEALRKGTPEWSALRDVFQLGLDIHTYTAYKMNGGDPTVYEGKDKAQIKTLQQAIRETLGGLRKGGKVANLGLLYAMRSKGFQDYANKVFNMGWDLDFADETRNAWLKAYPEVDLWHVWTELTFEETVWMANEYGSRRPTSVFKVQTLGGRNLYAFGLNAALAFPDQGSGADIIGIALRKLRERHPEIHRCVINQVHDELLLETSKDKAEAYAEIVVDVMGEAGAAVAAEFDVPITAEPAIGDVWIKD